MNITENVYDHDDHDDHDGLSVHNVVVAKVSAMLCLFFATLVFGSLPFKLVKILKLNENRPDSNAGKIISGLLSFGGGVLLATTFIHLQPEIAGEISILQKSGRIPNMRFSLSSLLMCSGFFLMYFIHELVHTYMHIHQNNIKESNDAENAFKRGISGRESSLRKKQTDETTLERINSSSQTEDQDQHQHQHHSHIHIAQLTTENDVFVTSLRGLLVVLALSVHELFEGLVIGLESSSTDVWYMFAAVSAHKLVLAFCVGVELVITKTKFLLALVYVFTFAVVSPIGIGIGTALTKNQDNSGAEIIAAILQGLACGTLLYVVFFEILSKEKRGSGLLQFLFVIIGFVFMFGLQIMSK